MEIFSPKIELRRILNSLSDFHRAIYYEVEEWLGPLTLEGHLGDEKEWKMSSKKFDGLDRFVLIFRRGSDGNYHRPCLYFQLTLQGEKRKTIDLLLDKFSLYREIQDFIRDEYSNKIRSMESALC